MRTIKACGLFGRSGRDFLIAYALSIPVLFGMFVSFYCAGRAFNAHVSLMDIFSRYSTFRRSGIDLLVAGETRVRKRDKRTGIAAEMEGVA